MGSSPVGQVVLIPFPFSDLSSTKLRPALILADAGRGDCICAQITSNAWSDPDAIMIRQDDFTYGSQRRISYARPGKLFTAHQMLFLQAVGAVSDLKRKEVAAGVVAMLEK